MTLVLPIHLLFYTNAHRTTIKVSVPIFSMSRNILAMPEFSSGGHHVGFQDDRHMFYFTLYLTSYCTLDGK